MKLSELKNGQKAIILKVEGSGNFRKRILEMGFVQGKEIEVIQSAPLKDPIYYKILDYSVSLRKQEAEMIEVTPIFEVEKDNYFEDIKNNLEISGDILTPFSRKTVANSDIKTKIKVALVGNPNSGKTSLFNIVSGAHEHVGNYSGVTISSKTGYLKYGDYRIEVVDLPGAYSLSAYSPEEIYIREELTGKNKPDIVINIVDTSNLERNLFLSLQLKEMGLPIVMALNMYDEFSNKKEFLNYPKLGKLLGIPMVPTVSRTGLGVGALFDTIVKIWTAIQENDEKYLDKESGLIRPININYGNTLEPIIKELEAKITKHLEIKDEVYSRYLAVKLIEGDRELENSIMNLYSKGAFIISAKNFALKSLNESKGENYAETIITDQRYGYIAGALKETYIPNRKHKTTISDKIDSILTHKIWGFPIFLLIMFIMFYATFEIGKYPQEWIENLVALFGEWVSSIIPQGPFNDLLVKGVIDGVGGVIVFLPNILILYLFISLMEDTGYMARTAFLMDKLMHKMGLHGKSFISLIMGFGCNVPAIMSTRTIESRKSRLTTILVLPFMSCSARLPVYILFAGVLFPNYSALVLLSMYVIGIIIAVLSARLLQSVHFKKEDTPFVMELPPYRMPTSKSILIHMWSRAWQYLRKMGTVILLASISVWFLGYFPRNEVVDNQFAEQIEIIENSNLDQKTKDLQKFEAEKVHNIKHQEQSYIGRMGKLSEPIIEPLGFDWKMGVSLMSGLVAKEIVVSTMGVIYTGDGSEDNAVLSEKILTEKRADGSNSFTPLIAFSFMLFVLIYFPCTATIIAIAKEAGSWKYGLFSIFYSCTLAYIVSLLVYQIGSRIF